MSNLVEHSRHNASGRDFVVGDLHGCYAELVSALSSVGFDASCDRLFSVGDLVDRGTDSLSTLRLLKEPWFFAVQGNHESMMLSAFDRYDSSYHLPTDFVFNGGSWAYGLSSDDQQELVDELLPLVEGLPYVRSVMDENGEVAFHVAHAELMTSARDKYHEDVAEGSDSGFLTDADLLKLKNLAPIQTNRDDEGIKRFQATSTWGRRVMRQVRQAQKMHSKKTGKSYRDYNLTLPGDIGSGSAHTLWPSETPMKEGLSLTFVGHTIVDQLALHASHFFMDRGAYQMYSRSHPESRLALLDAHATKRWLQEKNLVQIKDRPVTEQPSRHPYAPSKSKKNPVFSFAPRPK